MDFFQYEIRNNEGKIFILSLGFQYFLIKFIRFLSSFLFALSVLVIIWLFLFSSYNHPDLINCKIMKMFYPRLDEFANWGFVNNYYDLIKKDDQTILNQTISCSSTGLDMWSCLETYVYENDSKQQNKLKENMNYFELTEYLNNHHKNAFGRNHLLNCVLHFKTIDKLFVCWLKFTCDYKVFVVLHSVLLELGINYFICVTLKEQDIILNQNSFLNFHFSLLRNRKVMNLLRYCQCILIVINGFCYLLYGILPLTLPFAYLILNILNQDRFYVEYVNIIIFSIKYLIFLLKSTNFLVTET